MKKLLGTTALAVAIAASALAQTATPSPDAPQARSTAGTDAAAMEWLAQGDARDIQVSDLIGATIYAADEGEDTMASRGDWESVGKVNDLLLTREGEVRAILVDVGTFLGMGGKTVAAPLSSVRYVTADGDAEAADFLLVLMTDRETLQGAPVYERPERRAEDEAMMNTSTNNPTGAASPFTYDGYDRAEMHALTVDDLKSANVYGRGDDEIGSISKLIVTKEGKITDAVIDVGGFLGMGARSVSMPFADLTVLRKTGGDDVRVYIDATKTTLEAMPRYTN
jgi:hypothetical protein